MTQTFYAGRSVHVKRGEGWEFTQERILAGIQPCALCAREMASGQAVTKCGSDWACTDCRPVHDESQRVAGCQHCPHCPQGPVAVADELLKQCPTCHGTGFVTPAIPQEGARS